MANDPRTFLVTPCEKGAKKTLSETTKKRDFFSELGKVGDLEVLNDIGAGKISEGLRTLSKVSNTIRTGRSVVPGVDGSDAYNTTLSKITATALDSVNQGANTVLDTVGLGNAAESVGQFNPTVANRAVGQAKSIFQKVKQGNFEVSDIPEYFADLNNLEKLAKGIFTPPPSSSSRDIEMCGASPYAMDLIRFAPKQKFLFIVQFTFREPYQIWSNIGNDLAFVVKQSTRPKVSFDYEEMNMYNFRTRVPKRTIYDPMSMTFYDDNQNNANLFYTAYLRAMSPIANIGGISENSANSIMTVQQYQDESMNWDGEGGTTFGSNNGSGTATVYRGAGSLGALQNNVENILAEVRLFHLFEYGRLMNVYQFFHPKILSMTLDDLSMAETGNGSEMSFEFAYDGMYMIPNYDVSRRSPFNVERLTNQGDGFYPIKPNFGGTDAQTSGTDNATSAQQMQPVPREATDPIGVSVADATINVPPFNIVPPQVPPPASFGSNSGRGGGYGGLY